VIPAVAFIEGSGSALFAASHAGAVRAVVPVVQLPDATAAQAGRQAAVQLAGPSLGGALFGVARALPFVTDAASYAFSTVSLLAMRTPFQQERARDEASTRAKLAEGFRYLWSQPFLRTCALIFGLGNFIIPGVMLALVVIARQHGLSSGETGGLVAIIGASLLVGTLLSTVLRRLLSTRVIILLELWTWLGCAAFLVWPSVYVLTACVSLTALAIPSTDSVVHGYRIAMTPDRLLGRAEAVRSTISLAIAPFGPLVAGVLLATTSVRATIGFFAAAGVALAVWGTTSASIRGAPDLTELGLDSIHVY
jgi:cyanate permease